MRRLSRVITIEETCWTSGFHATFQPALHEIYDTGTQFRRDDVGDKRIARMDEAGIDLHVLSIVSPGSQMLESELAIRLSREANDWIGEASRRYPTRFAGFATLPTPEPAKAVEELTRPVEELGLKGGLINGHTHGVYLDDKRFEPLLARFARLGVPLYIHPANAPKPVMDTYFDSYPELAGPGWGWAITTRAHVLRLMANGVFDRHPDLKVIIGHMRELIKFHLKRVDRALRWGGERMERSTSDYMRDNVFFTTGAVFETATLMCAVLTLGTDNVLFSVNEPFDDNLEAVAWLKTVPLSDENQEKLAHGNAERLLGL